MEESTDDFFEQIKQTLHHHEEVYREGAWEQFSKRPLTASTEASKSVIALWKWVAAAAAVAAGIFFVAHYYFSNPVALNKKGTEITKTEAPIESKDNTVITPKDSTQGIIPNHEQTKPFILRNNEPLNNGDVTRLSNPSVVPIFSPENKNLFSPVIPIKPVPEIVHVPVKPNNQIAGEDKEQGQKFWENRIVTDDPVTRQQPPKNEPPLLAQTAPSKTQDSRDLKKWQSSIYVSPIFGENGINMGYGYSLGYAVNDKIKISTGIAHSKISTSRDFDTQGPAASNNDLSAPAYNGVLLSARSMVGSTAPAPKLETVEGSVTGIDIPIDVNYTISKKFYATAGVSGLVVLNDYTKYTYVTNKNVKVSVENNKGILKEDKNLVLQEYASSSSPTPETPGDKTSFIGFYNVSMGYKQKITPKNNISVEPFLKVPMQNVTQQKLNFMGAGLRLKFDF